VSANRLAHEIQAAHTRIEALSRRARGFALDQPALLEETLEELRVALEELRAAEAELSRQTEELELTVQTASAHARQAEAMRRTFLSSVSHELLTPLAIIKGHAETLRDPATRADPTLAEAALVAVDEEVERLRRLVANILDAARATSGIFTVDRLPLALGPIVERTVQRFHGRSRRHRFVTHLPAYLPLVVGDRDRLESVLYNLLDNAVKYAPRGGEVLVRIVVHSLDVEVAIEDEGVGIRWEDQARIFQPYYRADPEALPGAAGSGLGLYICKAIVEAHGGRIWVDSAPGRGTASHFTVPRAEPALLPVLAAPAGGAPP
jgi:signal transduction histidine kinase